ncbi:uncharacterized protein LAESUDRAFT_749160 [Laetiporus sulphureus 93-53]|uniref:Uncharacterized protein n=1 Tax=Laetiporus sulphureus 93-53 TaxID=1314785 RepID=A0A165EXT0_9APHY|nr:uncharacterized protein LAESUDRAFT_749160 [Laetiporus sulphureus 93-53]KZT07940.1 hypothetical protein LAESUDRAFT_749160 [Laetiporus sulphureus 93-53]
MSLRLNGRRTRRNSKPEAAPASLKAKPLDILPDLSEVDEGRTSLSSISSFDTASIHSRRGAQSPSTSFASRLCCSGSKNSFTERKRTSRRVVLTGVEGLTFDDFFPASSAPPHPSPAPPLYEDPISDCEPSLDDVNVRFSGLGISLDCPSPPADVPRWRVRSPTPSVASSATSSTASSSSSVSSRSRRRTHATPPTSDDESQSYLCRAPTCKSRRASIVYARSTPDLNESHASEEEGVDSDAEWFARDISDVVTLSTPLPPSSVLPQDTRARPDSLMPPPRRARRNRNGKPFTIIPPISRPTTQCLPSAQLDPTFPQSGRSFLIPDRSPPPPPIKITRCSTSTMEAATEELLAQLASAALGNGFAGTGLSATRGVSPAVSVPVTPSSAYVVKPLASIRPPPRSSIPADVEDLADEVELVLPEIVKVFPITPMSANMPSTLPVSPSSAFSFDVDVTHVDGSKPAGASNTEADLTAQTFPDTPTESLSFASAPSLRSRWSSSTLGALAERDGPAGSWLTKLNISATRRNKGRAGIFSPVSVLSAASPFGNAPKPSFDLEYRERRDSRGSDMSSDTITSKAKSKPVEVSVRT